MTAEAGLDFVQETGANGRLRLPEIMGGGVALFDYDGDGDLDLYLTNGSFKDADARSAPAPTNRLYSQEADGRFVDVTEASGLGDAGYGMGVAIGDVDNDGDADVYVTNHGADRLYLNRGDGRFDDATESAGIDVGGWSSSAVFFDYDLDGLLDLYVARYVDHGEGKACIDAAGRPDYCTPDVFAPLPDVLLHNEGGGRFRDVSDAAGLRSSFGPGLGVVAEDLDDDGRPDVYVANDGAANQHWTNLGDGSFRDDALLLGTAYNLDGRPEAGMGVVVADLDADLAFDLFLTHLAHETNTFYRNRNGRGFEDATGRSGLAGDSLAYTGFGTAALDIDCDGDLDLVVANGRVTRGEARSGSAMAPPWDRFAEPNLVFLNGEGGQFARGGAEVTSFTAPFEISRGLATGDIDADGDLDLVVSNLQSGARLYRNDAPCPGGQLLVRAVDPRHRRPAIGARITLIAGPRRQVRGIRRGSSYLSSSEPLAHFGLGGERGALELEVRWPDGSVEGFRVPGPDRIFTAVRGSGEAR